MKKTWVIFTCAFLAIFTSALHADSLATHVRSIIGTATPIAGDSWSGCGGATGPVMCANFYVSLYGDYVYVSSYYSGRICWFQRNLETADIIYSGSIATPYNDKWHWPILLFKELNNGSVVAYGVYGKQYSQQIYVYDVNLQTGELTLSAINAANIQITEKALISPDKKQIYTISERIQRFALNDSSGAMTAQLGITGPVNSDATGALFSPDGRFIYVANKAPSGGEAAVCIFSRDLSDGALGMGTSVNLAGISSGSPSLGMPPDGRHLYVCTDNTIMVFNRDSVAGTITLDSSYTAVTKMRIISDMVFNPDGLTGYYTANTYGGQCTGWFSRDPVSGKLTGLNFHSAGSGRYQKIAFDPENGNLYSTTFHYDASGTALSAYKTPEGPGAAIQRALKKRDAILSVCPNPFNPETIIKIQKQEQTTEKTRIRIFSVNGAMVRECILTGDRAIWNASGCPSGTYVVHAIVGKKTYSKRVTLLR